MLFAVPRIAYNVKLSGVLDSGFAAHINLVNLRLAGRALIACALFNNLFTVAVSESLTLATPFCLAPFCISRVLIRFMFLLTPIESPFVITTEVSCWKYGATSPAVCTSQNCSLAEV